VSIVDFAESARDDNPSVEAPISELLARQAGSVAGAGAMVLVAILIIVFAVRPLIKALESPAMGSDARAPEALALPDNRGSGIDLPEAVAALDASVIGGTPANGGDSSSGGWREIARDIERMLEADESRVINQVKEWLAQEEIS
jgi:flagellar biosynthesis/type III secretory pathway M-ring protein FliF/YscJ